MNEFVTYPEPVKKSNIRIIVFFVAGFLLGAFSDWYYFRPFSICPDPKTLKTTVNMKVSLDKPYSIVNKTLWECFKQ